MFEAGVDDRAGIDVREAGDCGCKCSLCGLGCRYWCCVIVVGMGVWRVGDVEKRGGWWWYVGWR